MTKDGRAWKWLLYGILIGAVIYLCWLNAKDADAAQTVTSNLNGSVKEIEVYELKEMDWSEWLLSSAANTYYLEPEILPDKILEENPYLIVWSNNGTRFNYYFFENPVYYTDSSYSGQLNFVYYKNVTYIVDVEVIEGIPKVLNVSGKQDKLPINGSSFFVMYTRNNTSTIVGSNYDFLEKCTDASFDVLKSKVSRSNLVYPEALEYPTVEELFDFLPEGLKEYQCFIVFRQDSSAALEKNIVFYGWNDIFAELYISKKNSQICAMRNRSVVPDSITAYFDLELYQWIIKDVVLGATNDLSFHVPIIYYTNSTLFICDENWYSTGEVVEMASLDPPPFSENLEEDEDGGFLGKILSGLKNLLHKLFVPSSGFMDSKVAYLRSKFSFCDAICSTATVIHTFFEETDFTEPPVITVDLSAARSKYNYGGSAICFDMSWYEEYKPSVDAFLSGVLWVVFAWNTFKNLPSIISGVSTAVDASTKVYRSFSSRTSRRGGKG